jgi:hypothetical protein
MYFTLIDILKLLRFRCLIHRQNKSSSESTLRKRPLKPARPVKATTTVERSHMPITSQSVSSASDTRSQAETSCCWSGWRWSSLHRRSRLPGMTIILIRHVRSPIPLLLSIFRFFIPFRKTESNHIGFWIITEHTEIHRLFPSTRPPRSGDDRYRRHPIYRHPIDLSRDGLCMEMGVDG